MVSTSEICDKLGRGNIAVSLGVKPQAVSNAVNSGKFPAKWYRVIKEQCAQADIECPDEVFSFVKNQQVDAA
jgi:hypothetical protein